MATRNGASWSTVLTALGCGLVGGVALGATAPVGLGLQRDLDLSLEALGWAASAITAVPAALGLAAGWWIRRPGPRRALVLGLLVLAVAGGVTAAAPNGAALLAGRFVQGVGYLLVVVASPIAIAGATDGAARRLALAIWTTVIPAGLALAAAAGGAVLAVAGWRAWLGLAAAAALLLVVPAARVTIGGAPPGAAARPAALGVRPKRQTDLRRPCTPSRGPASAVLGHAVDGAPCAPRRRPTIWGTWPPNLSPAFPARPLARPLLLAGGFGAVALIGVAVIVGFPTYLAAQRGLGSAAAGAATSLVPLSSIAGSLLAGWLLGRGARLRTLAPFALAFPVATSLAFWAALPSAANVAAGMAVLAANGVLVAAIFASAPDVVADARDIDVTNGLLAQFGSLGNLVGPPLFAAAVAHGGWATMGPATLPAAAAALGLLLAASVSPAGRASPHPRSVPPRPPARR